MSCARPALDRRPVQTVDIQLVTHFFKKPQLGLAQPAIRRRHIAGQRIRSLVQPLRQGITHQPEEGVQPVLFLEQIKHNLGHLFQAVAVITTENRQVIHDLLDRDQFCGSDRFIRCRYRDHNRDQCILFAHGVGNVGHNRIFPVRLAPQY